MALRYELRLTDARRQAQMTLNRRHRITSDTYLRGVCCGNAGAVVFSTPALAGAARPNVHGLGRLKTEIRSTSGTLIATIDNDHYDPVHECWIDHVSQRTIDVGIDYTTFGGAVKSSNSRRWNVWEGPKLVGAVISRSGTRWDLYRWKTRTPTTAGSGRLATSATPAARTQSASGPAYGVLAVEPI